MRIHRLIVEQVILTLEDIFLRGAYADKAIERVLKSQRKWGARDRRFFAESVYECVRWKRKLEFLIDFESEDLDREALARLWAAWAYEQEKIEDPGEWGLRKDVFHERQKRLASEAPRAVQESIPDWLDQLGQDELGERWSSVLRSLNQKAPVDLRTNTLKTIRTKLQEQLKTEGIETWDLPRSETALTLTERKNVFTTKAFAAGFFEVQDRASQLVAPLLDPQSGERIADACAGAGGKSLHIAALMKNKGRILSLDIHEWKLKELRTRARRAGVDIIETRLIEGSKTIKRLQEGFDRVLLDVPCSGLGVLRRNPDSKWKLSPEELTRLRDLQFEILRSYSRLVRPGGTLVYATCSLLPSENQRQIEKFLNSEWTLIEEIRVLPDEGRGDGFFAAKLRRFH